MDGSGPEQSQHPHPCACGQCRQYMAQLLWLMWKPAPDPGAVVLSDSRDRAVIVFHEWIDQTNRFSSSPDQEMPAGKTGAHMEIDRSTTGNRVDRKAETSSVSTSTFRRSSGFQKRISRSFKFSSCVVECFSASRTTLMLKDYHPRSGVFWQFFFVGCSSKYSSV